jgi:hypothetical protein
MKTGSLVLMKVATKLLIGETSTSFTSDSNAIDVSNKQSGRDTNVEYGRMNRTFTVTSIAETTPNGTYWGVKDALDAQEAGTKVAVLLAAYTTKVGTTYVSGDWSLVGTALITNVSVEAGDDAANTLSVTLQIDGALTTPTT